MNLIKHILGFTACVLIAVWVFLTVIVPISNKFLYNKVQYVPFCPADPPEGLELMGEAELL
jgi:hypothetical protein